MTDKITLKADFQLLENNENVIKITNAMYINDLQQQFLQDVQHEIEKRNFLEDLVYKHLETNILQEMKLKIENELLKRKLKNEVTND